MTDDDRAPGWDAIDAALAAVYPDQPPVHWAPPVPPPLGRDPLNGVSVYRAVEPVRHWHYITYGFSDLFGRDVTDDPQAASGLGFELTLRLLDPAAAVADAQPPVWPINLLMNMASYAFAHHTGFAIGHKMSANGPIMVGSPTKLHAMAFIEDPRLGTIATPSGRLRFLQVVGITDAEFRAGSRWDMNKLMILFEQRFPWSLTWLERDDLMDDPDFAADVDRMTRRDGSSTTNQYVSHLRHEVAEDGALVIELGASAVAPFTDLVALRLPYGHRLHLQGRDQLVVLAPGNNEHRIDSEGICRLELDDDTSRAAAEVLRPQRGEYRLPGLDDVVWRVVPSEIKDPDGRVVEIIG